MHLDIDAGPVVCLLRLLHPPLDVSVLDPRAPFRDLGILHPCDLERPVLPVLQGVGEQVPCVPFVMDGQRFDVRPGSPSVRVPVVEGDALPVGDGRLQQGVQVLDPFVLPRDAEIPEDLLPPLPLDDGVVFLYQGVERVVGVGRREAFQRPRDHLLFAASDVDVLHLVRGQDGIASGPAVDRIHRDPRRGDGYDVPLDGADRDLEALRQTRGGDVFVIQQVDDDAEKAVQFHFTRNPSASRCIAWVKYTARPWQAAKAGLGTAGASRPWNAGPFHPGRERSGEASVGASPRCWGCFAGTGERSLFEGRGGPAGPIF